jgi:putative endonuclease
MSAPVSAPAGSRGGLLLNAQRWGLLRLQAVARRVSRGKPLPKHLQVGVRGEFEALFFLRRMGFTVVERRWRSPELNGDLDLVAWEGATLCFVEVKTRTARDRTPAGLAVDEAKQNMLRRMAASYVRTLPEEYRKDALPRFDVVSVYLLDHSVECELLRDAFERRPGGFAWRGV